MTRDHRPCEGHTTAPDPSLSTRDDNTEDQVCRTLCDICTGEEWITRHLACGHNVCKICIRVMVGTAVLNRTMWPPSCCYYNPTEQDIAWGGGPELLKTYRDINREFSEKDLTYCSRQRCSELLYDDEPDHEGMLTCKACGTRTCTKCKQGSHEERGCVRQSDPDIEAMIKKENWQKCRRCNRVISIESGCNHMRCLCGYEFCYYCGESWYVCECTNGGPATEEPPAGLVRLLEQARVIEGVPIDGSHGEEHGASSEEGAVEGKGKGVQTNGSDDRGATTSGHGRATRADGAQETATGRARDTPHSNDDNNNDYLRELLPPSPFHHQLSGYLPPLPRRRAVPPFSRIPVPIPTTTTTTTTANPRPGPSEHPAPRAGPATPPFTARTAGRRSERPAAGRGQAFSTPTKRVF
ncbi:hypothetical protein F4775DRAFT_535378 [Biscogniauxia sp. FL1348]|nr:hypothetical protein F4775DRAFT_535378 [Biscogniauxia sp. FL1348]